MSGPAPVERLKADQQLRRNCYEPVYLLVSRGRDRPVAGENAADDAEVDGVDERAGGAGPPHGPGQPLERTGKIVKGKQKAVTDGPFAEAKDVIGGYSIVEATDLDQAVQLSKGCPIFEVEGAVEVRPVMTMNM